MVRKGSSIAHMKWNGPIIAACKGQREEGGQKAAHVEQRGSLISVDLSNARILDGGERPYAGFIEGKCQLCHPLWLR